MTLAARHYGMEHEVRTLRGTRPQRLFRRGVG